MNYRIVERTPTIEEYSRLCRAVGWGEIINVQAAEKGLPRSVFAVVVLAPGGETVGMGRIVGDGAMYYYIQDIAVHPEHQGQGLGTKILNALFHYLQEQALPKSFIGLFSVPEAVGFYSRFTLQQRDLIGLFTVKELIGSRNG